MKSVQFRSLLSLCILSSTALLPAPAVFAQGSTMQERSPAPTRSTQSSLSSVDRQFMTKAAQSDMTEIKTSQLALQRSRNSQVREYAQMMIQQHTESSNKLKPLAAQKGATLPTSLGPTNTALLSQLTKLSGTQFDQAYLQGQAKAHSTTQAVYQEELQQGQDPAVKAFANQILPVVTKHLQMVNTILARR